MLKKKSQVLSWILVFLLASGFLYLILPGEPRFRYEYQKGTPWSHENLVAPFDFAIQKTADELEHDRQEQLKSIIPYFIYDTLIFEQKAKQLTTDWQALTDPEDDAAQEALKILFDQLGAFYQTGILPRSAETYEELKDKSDLRKRVGTRVTRISKESIYSEKSAYNDLNETLQTLSEKFPELQEALQQLQPERYIASNLTYDNITTQKEREEALKNISTTRGLVQAGERIILQGEIVNDERFQVLESLKASFELERGEGINRYMLHLGKAALILVFMILLFTFLFIYRIDILSQFSKLAFLMLFFVSIIFFTIFVNSFPMLHIYMVPFAIFPIVIHTFFDSRTAIFTLIIASLITGFYAPNNYEFILLEVTAGMVAVFSLNKTHRRGHVIKAIVWVLLTYIVVYTSLEMIFEGTLTTINYKMLQWFSISSILIVLVYPLVFIFEKIFGFVSDVTLIELSDTNQPLLRKMAEQAPGSFQHSLQIANLSEEIILRIGGNPFLVRAGALYHDIGKIATPEFFIENQAVGINPHDKLNYMKSAEVIIDHVKNGVKLARKYNLPEALTEFIATHHGTTKAQYFYLKHQEENPHEKVDETNFVYPGPLPHTKEAAVVMIVDGIEAATRSLKDKTHENIKEVVSKMIDQKIRDGQLSESLLSFRDIRIIKETLLEKLLNIYHVRIEYPKDKESDK